MLHKSVILYNKMTGGITILSPQERFDSIKKEDVNENDRNIFNCRI